MKKTIGILAHVDAGKTTFCEALLYQTHAIRKAGRVDAGTSLLDSSEMEQQRGITIFSDQAVFHYNDNTYYLIDTPGHIDFSAETERTLQILDYAVLLINGKEGVQAHTITLFHLLEVYQIPVFLFINKSDMDGVDVKRIMVQLKQKLNSSFFYFSDETALEDLALEAAEHDDIFAEKFFDGNYSSDEVPAILNSAVSLRKFFPVCSGSALKNIGISFFLSVLDNYTAISDRSRKISPGYERTDVESNGTANTVVTATADMKSGIAASTVANTAADTAVYAKVYKIRHDSNHSRITFLKLLSGTLCVKDSFSFSAKSGIETEKINEIRIYQGEKYESVKQASEGDVIGVTGLKTPVCGSTLGSNQTVKPAILMPALQSKIVILDQTSKKDVIFALRELEAEDPLLSASFIEDLDQIQIHVMGKIQLEILKQVFLNRFHISLDFEKPEVLYQETIRSSVMGYGHFEPLRHYAEVNLRLEPAKRGSGISFSSECHVDTLSINYQKLIQTHVFERVQKGILTGSPLTDVHITLTSGRAHIKHTEGGDFREAVYRAIRQGLEKSESLVLEPYYRFEIQIPGDYLGRVLSDLQKYSCEFDPPESQSGFSFHHSSNCPSSNHSSELTFFVKGFGPVSELMEYQAELAAASKGLGSIALILDGYRPCHNQDAVIEAIGYQKDSDRENPSASVFCSKGTSFFIPWYEAEEHMHCLKS